MPTITLRLDGETHGRLENLAKATDRSKAYLAGRALRAYLNLNEWQVSEIEKGMKEAAAGLLVDHADVRTKWEAKVANSLDASSDAKPRQY